MKNSILIAIPVLLIGGVARLVAIQALPNKEAPSDVVAEAVIFKSPSCSCCGQYAAYLERKGYDVAVEGVADMSAVKERYGVPYELESCHTMEVAGYIVEGHVPEEAVAQLLTERPSIRGIGMAGMPSGSPGMPGPKTSPFVIYEITNEGTRGSVFMSI